VAIGGTSLATIEGTGRTLKLRRERVRQIEAKALSKLEEVFTQTNL